MRFGQGITGHPRGRGEWFGRRILFRTDDAGTVGVDRVGDFASLGVAPVNRPVPRSPLSAGLEWTSRIGSVGAEFALPPLLGGYLDRRWGTGSLLTILGAILGFLIGMAHLLAFAREGAKAAPKRIAPPAESSDRSTDGPQ